MIQSVDHVASALLLATDGDALQGQMPDPKSLCAMILYAAFFTRTLAVEPLNFESLAAIARPVFGTVRNLPKLTVSLSPILFLEQVPSCLRRLDFHIDTTQTETLDTN